MGVKPQKNKNFHSVWMNNNKPENKGNALFQKSTSVCAEKDNNKIINSHNGFFFLW